jgi:hypothetical protein
MTAADERATQGYLRAWRQRGCPQESAPTFAPTPERGSSTSLAPIYAGHAASASEAGVAGALVAVGAIAAAAKPPTPAASEKPPTSAAPYVQPTPTENSGSVYSQAGVVRCLYGRSYRVVFTQEEGWHFLRSDGKTQACENNDCCKPPRDLQVWCD